MHSWPRAVIRTFAVLNILLGLFGLLALLTSAYGRLRIDPWRQDPPYFAQAYYLQSVINLIFVVTAIWVGPQLWRLRPRAKAICNILFCAEIGYFWAGVIIFLVGVLHGGEASVLSHALEVSGGAGNMGIGLQLATGYPLIALVGINIAYRRLKSQTPAVAQTV